VKFRRKSEKPDPAAAEPGESADSTGHGAGEGANELVDAEGPFDIDDLPEDGVERVDLGSLLITPEEDRELRLQVDENTQAVQAVLLAGPDGALELRAFAAPRHGDLWTEVRPQLAADLARRGGTATEREGRFGTELVCELSVQTAEGRAANQSSRIIGINGPRWMLRGTFLGRPATDPDNAAAWEDTLTKVVIRRGDHAMPVGDPLPVVLPDSARRTSPDES
jgi:Protein of unknown function (DUF3710)